MALPAAPSPCPNLRPGRALGAPEHQGFAATWNWIVGIFRNAAKFLVSSVNGKAGDVSVVGGDGIQVVTSGNTITINVGDGEDENDGDGSGGGGSGGGGSGGGGSSGGGSGGGGSSGGGSGGSSSGGGGSSGGGSGGDDGSSSANSGCNSWSEDLSNGDGDGDMGNLGDNCTELNGW